MRRLAWLVVVPALLLPAAGSQGAESVPAHRSAPAATGFESTLAAVSRLHGPARTRKLGQLARKDGGKLTLYISLTDDLARKLAAKFEHTYGLDVTIYRATTEDVVPKIEAEAKANFHGADVVEANGLGLVQLAGVHLLVPYASPQRSALVKGSNYRAWTADRFLRLVVGWNTSRVPAGQQPKRWEDLANARWKGQLALELNDYGWYEALWNYWVKHRHKTPAQADRLFARIAQNAVVLKGHTLINQLLEAGEVQVAASSYSHLVDLGRQDGAPVAWRPAVQPVMVLPAGVGLVTGAPHPAAALLFVDWILGADAQKTLVKFAFPSVRRDLHQGSSVSAIVIGARTGAGQAAWRARYARLLAHAKPGPTG